MKKFYIPYIVFCIITLTLITFSYKKFEQPDTQKCEKMFYMIKTTNNKTYLYNKKKQLIKEINIDLNNLRRCDKENLKKGIIINSMQELNHILEDFSN